MLKHDLGTQDAKRRGCDKEHLDRFNQVAADMVCARGAGPRASRNASKALQS